MKKIKSILIFLLLTNSLLAQTEHKFHLQFLTGYNYGLPFQEIGTKTLVDNKIKTERNIYGSYQKGLGASLEMAYSLSFNFAIGLQARYNVGFNQNVGTLSDSLLNVSIKGRTNQFGLFPFIIIDAPMGKINPYLKAGPYFAFNKSTHYTRNFQAGDTKVIQEVNEKNTSSLGLQTALGVNIRLTDKVSIPIELAYITAKTKPKSLEIVKWTFTDGTGTKDVLNDPTTTAYNTQIVYVEEFTNLSNDALNGNLYYHTDKPQEVLTFVKNMSSLGIYTGINFNF